MITGDISQRIDVLNGIKGWFIFVIVIYHTFNSTGLLADILSPIKQYGGYFGNSLFFMMSGFLTGYSFSRKKVSERSFLSFLQKKLLKLWPFYAICNLWQLGISVVRDGAAFHIKDLLLVLLMQTGGALTDNYPYVVPGWFLCTLMVCYVVNYFVRYICRDDLNKYIWCFYVLFVWGLFLDVNDLGIPFCYAHNGVGFSNFFLGSILFEYYCDRNNRKPLLVLLIGMTCFLFSPFRSTPGITRLIPTIFVSPALIILSLEHYQISRFFRCRTSQWLGKISMYVYLLHTVNPLPSIPSRLPHYVIGYIFYLIVLIILAEVSSRLMPRLTKLCIST